MTVRIKRVYDTPEKSDGMRILIDRIWPRGLTKAGARVDLWLKEIAPSTELRKWFGHDPGKWTVFKRRYRSELEKNREPVAALRRIARTSDVTLLYGARDERHNNALALKDYLRS